MTDNAKKTAAILGSVTGVIIGLCIHAWLIQTAWDWFAWNVFNTAPMPFSIALVLGWLTKRSNVKIKP